MIKARAAETEESEFTALVAYGIYKKKKHETIKGLRDELQKEPTQEELQPFVKLARQNVDLYLGQALSDIQAYQNELVGGYIEYLNNEYREKYIEEAKKFKPSRFGWFGAALIGVLGNVLTVLLTFVLFFALAASLSAAPSFKEFCIQAISKL